MTAHPHRSPRSTPQTSASALDSIKSEHRIQNTVALGGIGGQGRNRQLQGLVNVLFPGFNRRDIEFGPDLCQQALELHAFFLQRMDPGRVKAQGHDCNNHEFHPLRVYFTTAQH